ncbi:hypothetical protein E3N88_16572 [Mikania micrantha]|uniref:F-box associated beta-propeller type 1 domain-containing protein n=1 Tax=Mikania micrantha TaxID=192012 RepID=A0A5N6NZ57_9ASTR|nr:hypothetical protein E3N88_16572 [Mikania micrantha]
MEGNPLIKEVRKLSLPPRIGTPLCWGFGYDSSNDDYKVILGSWKGMNFQVFSLKSNTWKVVIGELNYAFIRKNGVLINGALHWIVKDRNMKKLIISFDLSKEEVTEIPQPDDARYECNFRSYLGVINECLCIFQKSQDSIWLIEYKVKQSWQLLSNDHEINKYDVIHYLRTPDDFILPESVFRHDESCFSISNLGVHMINAPIFVQSLVSPYFNASQKQAGIVFRQIFERLNASSCLWQP